MTTPSDDAAEPVPVRVVLPADPVLGHPEQEVVARLWRRRQTETGWLYLVGLPSYRDREDGGVLLLHQRLLPVPSGPIRLRQHPALKCPDRTAQQD